MAPTRVILMSCGSYNPPTNMHLRMFEIARDHLHRMGTHIVVGGVISPVHDAYAKKELASASHRCAMLRLALQNSDWIKLSSWETRQNGWTKTRISLQQHQNLLNSVLLDSNNMKHHMDMEDLEWIPENVRNSSDNSPIQIKLLCGGDLLESFGTCDLWAEEDIDAIVGEHGLVVITREGSSPNKFIYDSDTLSKHMHNIYIVTEWIPNEVSSSRIRRALKRGESVRYLLQDSVIDYIYKHGIYDAKPTTAIIKLELTSPNANNYLTIDSKYQNTFLTPSPSDVTMESPSPIEIISIDVPDSVLRKNMQNVTSVSCLAARHSGLEEVREKFINALVAENGNAKHLAAAKAAYPGLAKQIIATETGESQILGEVGFADDDKKVRSVVKVQPRPNPVEQEPLASSGVAKSSKVEENAANSPDAPDDPTKETVRLEETRDESTVKEDITSARLVACKDAENKSSISSPSLSTNSAVDNSGRHECALSDFSVDKEDYRLTRYGLDQDAEDEPQGPSHEFDSMELHSYSDDLPQDSRANNMPKIQDTVMDERSESDNALEQDNFSDDSIRCSNTQVLVLVSAMIHNNGEQETTATVIVEENETHGTGEITFYKGDPETSTEKLSFTIQSPVPTTISEESTVTIQEITNDIPESTNQVADAFVEETRSVRRDGNLEIDGKYLKSVVNSRKSPRKAKSEQMRLYDNDPSKTEETKKAYSRSDDVFQKPARSSKSKSPRKEPRSSRSHPGRGYDTRPCDFTSVSDERMRRVRQYDAPLKGSLDSVVVTSDPREMPGRKARASEKAFSKKSKSYESIKKIQEVYLEESSKTDSTSKLITANDYDLQTDEYCSVCCYANEMSLRTEEMLGSPTQETFYTLRSNCSSFADEDSTECDICSSWNLQESTDTLDRKILTSEGDPFCEVCEICGEVSTTYDTSQDSILPMAREPNFQDASSYRIPDNAMTDPSMEDDSFEIENCGFRSGGESTEDRGIFTVATEPIKKRKKKPLSTVSVTSDPPVIKETLRERYFVPKDEVAILTSGARRIGRKGSLLRRTTEESGSAAHDKRRYSSVDNLQGSKVTTKVSERPLRSKHSKLIGSADNIRSSRSSRRCKSLQRSADNVRYLDSSTDNLDSLAEGFGKEEDKPRAIEWIGKPKIRDNETVKMILTKHGIKIISEKETAL